MISNWYITSAISALTISIANAITKKRAQESSSNQTIFFSNLIAVIILFPFFIRDIGNIEIMENLPALIIISIFSFIGVISFTQALRIDMTRTSLSMPFAFITLTVSGLIFFHEISVFTENRNIFIAFLLSLIGMYLTMKSNKADSSKNATKWLFYIGLNLIMLNASMVISKMIAPNISSIHYLFITWGVGLIFNIIIMIRSKEKIKWGGKLLGLDVSNAIFTLIGRVLYYNAVTNTELSKVVLIRTPLLAVFTLIWSIFLIREESKLSKKNLFGGGLILSGLLFAV